VARPKKELTISAKKTPVDLEQTVECITSSLEDDKALDIVNIGLVGKTSIADYMIIASGTSARQVSAMSDHVVDKLRSLGIRAKTEGADQSDWVLIDAGDVIVHLFRPEVRAFYNIEKIWAFPGEGESSPNLAPARSA
jgi:ribosome-associated protein